MSTPLIIHWSWQSFDDFTNPHALYAVLALRSRAFVLEQHCAYLDLDGLDAEAWHLLGHTPEKQIVAYARVFLPARGNSNASVGRVVVDSRCRGQGIATQLMQQAIDYINHSLTVVHTITLSAQHHLQGFYHALGFIAEGEPYDEEGVLHIDMRLALSTPKQQKE